MTEQKDQLEELNDIILITLERIKGLYERKYPDEYKIIRQSLIKASNELASIRTKPFKIKTDENNTCHNKFKM